MSGSPVYTITSDQEAELARIDRRVVPGKSCGTRSLCCKVVSITEFAKRPAFGALMPGRGCGIHLDRPFVCRGAYCHWMLTPGLGPEWKPEVAKFAIFVRNGGTRITAHVDAGHPGAWRREPYYKTFKAWAAKAIAQRPQMHMVDVMIGERTTVILPGRDVEVGIIAADEAVQLDRHMTGTGEIVDVRVIKRATEEALSA